VWRKEESGRGKKRNAARRKIIQNNLWKEGRNGKNGGRGTEREVMKAGNLANKVLTKKSQKRKQGGKNQRTQKRGEGGTIEGEGWFFVLIQTGFKKTFRGI